MIAALSSACSPSRPRDPQASRSTHSGLSIREVVAPGEAQTGEDRVEAFGKVFWLKPGQVVTGRMVANAFATIGQDNRAVIDFRLTDEGRRRLAELTRRSVGRPIAVLVDGRLVAAPMVAAPIENGSGEITGNFDRDAANDLVEAIRDGGS